MFSPVHLSGTAPQLTASVPSVHGPTINGPSGGPNYRGGPVFGLNSLSEPNTSPDTITIQGYMVWPTDADGAPEISERQSYMFPSGTPVYVVPSKKNATAISYPQNLRMDRHKEPIHKVYTQANKETESGSGAGFLTVLVGPATFKKDGSLTHFAVAVQHVASVHVAHMNTTAGTSGERNAITKQVRAKWPIGSRLYMCIGEATDRYKFTVSDKMLATPTHCRQLRLTATEVGGEIKCDLGSLH